MTDGLDWRVAIVGYDRIQWARYLNAYARQSGEPEPSMDDGRRETHFAQYIDNEGELRRSFYQALLNAGARVRDIKIKVSARVLMEVIT